MRAMVLILRYFNQSAVEPNQRHCHAGSEHGEHCVREGAACALTLLKLIDRHPVTVAYLRHLGPYGEPLSAFWQNTYKPWAVMNKLREHARYGISHDDPTITAADQCRYDVCAEVAPNFVASGGALKTTIPGGRYTALSFKGTVKQVGEAWTLLLRDWLPSSGLQLDARPFFEYYPKGAAYDSQMGIFECEICIPVAPL